jgi:membrane protein involved in colicin uptake
VKIFRVVMRKEESSNATMKTVVVYGVLDVILVALLLLSMPNRYTKSTTEGLI